MRKIKLIRLIGLICVFGLLNITSAFAFSEGVRVGGARVNSNSFFNYNTNTNRITISLNSGPVQVGSGNHSLPAYQSISQTIAQIQALKNKLKNFSPK